jgi:pimeloyl-ACP methyl ester carboxylesterase
MAEFSTATGHLHYEVYEQAPAGLIEHNGANHITLTLLHNFMSTGDTAWGTMIEDLRRHYRILVPDLPGHGQSLGYPIGFHHTVMAQQVAALMEAEGANYGHLAGCSSGGMIAQLLVHHDLIAPASVTLVSTTYTVDYAKLTSESEPLETDNFRAGRRWLEATARLHDPFHYDGYFEDELLTGFRKLTPRTAIDLPLTAYETWPMPVCIIHGAEDEFFPAEVAQQMATALPDAELNIVPKQSHALIFRRPWQVANLLEAFLAQVDSPTSYPDQS